MAYIPEIIKCGTHAVKKVLLATFLGTEVRITQVKISIKTNSGLSYVVFTLHNFTISNSTSSYYEVLCIKMTFKYKNSKPTGSKLGKILEK